MELVSRKPSWPAAAGGRTDRPNIWMQAIRSALKTSCSTGAVHIWVPGSRPAAAPRDDDAKSLDRARRLAFNGGMIRVTDHIEIDEAELEESFVRDRKSVV